MQTPRHLGRSQACDAQHAIHPQTPDSEPLREQPVHTVVESGGHSVPFPCYHTPSPKTGCQVLVPCNEIVRETSGTSREFFFFLNSGFISCIFSSFTNGQPNPENASSEETTSTLNKTHGVRATQANGTWGAKARSLSSWGRADPRTMGPSLGATPVRRHLARRDNGQQEVHHGTQSHGKPRNRQPNAETGCSIFLNSCLYSVHHGQVLPGDTHTSCFEQ